MYDLDGRPVDRLFVSAQTGEGLGALRQKLAQTLLAAQADMTPGDLAEFPTEAS
jgi:GTP-binding protein HflX